MTVRGVILEGELYGHGDDAEQGERLLVFLELENGFVHVRRSYGTRATVATVELADVEAALAALKTEQARKPPAPMPGQLDLDNSDAT